MKRISAAVALAACVIFVAGASADPLQNLTISDVTVTEGGTATFTVSLSAGNDPDTTVQYATANGTATSPGDYTTDSGTITVPAGGSQTIVISTVDDSLHESTEDFTVELSNASAATIQDGSGTGTINDDDATPSLAISGPASVSEAAGTADYTVAITGQSASTVTVNFAGTNGTATGSDFSVTPGTLTWSSGDTASKTITANITDDTLDEDDESFAVTLSSPSGATISTGTANTTITDNDNPPTTGAFDNVSTAEGNSGTHELNFTVNLSAASGKAVTINYSTIDGTATSPSDYASEINQTITIPAGQTTGTIGITINGDTVPESSESFTVNLNSATNASLGADTQATGTITNDDSGVTASIDDVAVAEGNSGTATATFTISLSGPAPTASTITWRTADGTATAGSDYVGVGNTVLNIAQNATSAQVQVTINGDTTPEPNETFFVDLISSTGSVSIGPDNRGNGTITNDDSGVTASIDDVTVTEGNSGTTTATFTISLSGPAPTASTITWRTADGTATAGSDYVGVGNTVLNIAQNATSAQVQVTVNGDTSPEANETFFVDLISSTGSVNIGPDNRGNGTITNDDSTPSASINDVTVTEGNSGTVNAVFTVSLSSAAPSPVTITWRTADGTATSPGDYVGQPNTVLNIAQGASSGTITIAVNGDISPEANETFFVDLISSTGPVIISSDNRGIGTITNDDSTPSASINDVTVTEGNTGNVNATFTVTLSSPASAPVQIRYSTVNGTATSPADYDGVTNLTLNIAQGASSGTFNITVHGDTLPEGSSENFFVDLVGSTGPVTISSDSRGIGTITDDDSTPSASINDVSVTEGNSGTVQANFTVTLSSAAPAQVQLRWSTANGTATAGSDYVGQTNQVLTIAQGGTTGQISVAVNGDLLPEANETFFVDLVAVVSGPVTIGPSSRGTGTITNDDATPSASINDVSVTEGNAPSTVNATFTVTLSSAAAAQVQVHYSTVNGSATSPTDYAGVTNQVVTIASGATTGTFSIVVNGDGVPEGTGTPLAENFFVDLISITGPATISSDSRGTGTIVDDDNPVSASINDIAVTEGHTGTVNATFTVALSGPAAAQIQIRYSTANGTATAPDDFTAVSNAILTIPQGQSSGTFNIEVKGDTLPEGTGSPPAETYFVDLVAIASGPATISSDSRGNGRIVDDDSPVTASIDDITVTEGNTGGVNATFAVILSGPAQATLQIRYTTVNGSAQAPDDYIPATNAVLTINQGQSTGTFSIVVKGDVLPEGTGTPPAEDFFVDLVSATGPVTIGSDSRGRGLIVDDDAPVTASVNDVSVTEGNEGTVIAKFTVGLSGGAPGPVTIQYSTSDGSATSPDDYTGVANGVLNLAQGATGGTFNIVVKGDTIVEDNENFIVVITPTGATPGDTTGVGTILDDEPRPPSGGGGGSGTDSLPSLTITDTVAQEGQAATFTVSVLGTMTKAVTVNFSTTDGTAKAGFDYLARTGTLTFEVGGSREQTFTVSVLKDTESEGAETFHVSLSGASNATILKSLATATITAAGSGPGPNVTPAGVQLPKMVLGPRTPTVVAKGYAIMTISCIEESPIACSGSIVLESITKPVLKLGTKKFTVQKGRVARVHVFLSKRALALLKKNGTLKARAVVLVKDSKRKDVRVVPGVVTLKATAGLIGQKAAATKTTTTKKAAPKKAEEPPPIKVEVEP